MRENHKIAIIGNKETILGFKALGLKTVNANTTEEAVKALFELKAVKLGTTEDSPPLYAIVFITEDLAAGISKEDMKKLSQSALPAIIPLPSSKGTTGFGLKRIGKMVEQAVGSDIFGDSA
ncbi:MAG: V-type ATP synthase subunit F [Candidatus Peregrinibacteria bacterium]